MLILRPVNGTWYVVSSEFPGGHWAAFSDEDAARTFLQWMVDSKFDCVGILSRLHFGSLTIRDRNTVKWINHASRTRTRVWSRREPVIVQIARQRRKASDPVPN